MRAKDRKSVAGHFKNNIDDGFIVDPFKDHYTGKKRGTANTRWTVVFLLFSLRPVLRPLYRCKGAVKAEGAVCAQEQSRDQPNNKDDGYKWWQVI